MKGNKGPFKIDFGVSKSQSLTKHNKSKGNKTTPDDWQNECGCESSPYTHKTFYHFNFSVILGMRLMCFLLLRFVTAHPAAQKTWLPNPEYPDSGGYFNVFCQLIYGLCDSMDSVILAATYAYMIFAYWTTSSKSLDKQAMLVSVNHKLLSLALFNYLAYQIFVIWSYVSDQKAKMNIL
jgi:hypothetical protein